MTGFPAAPQEVPHWFDTRAITAKDQLAPTRTTRRRCTRRHVMTGSGGKRGPIQKRFEREFGGPCRKNFEPSFEGIFSLGKSA